MAYRCVCIVCMVAYRYVCIFVYRAVCIFHISANKKRQHGKCQKTMLSFCSDISIRSSHKPYGKKSRCVASFRLHKAGWKVCKWQGVTDLFRLQVTVTHRCCTCVYSAFEHYAPPYCYYIISHRHGNPKFSLKVFDFSFLKNGRITLVFRWRPWIRF